MMIGGRPYVYSGALALYRAALCALSLVFTMAVPATAAAAIAYVQGAYVTGTTTATATVKYGSAQNAGDLNVVVIAWVGSTPTVQSVTDSKGNAYAAASAATIDSGVGAQQIWYAKNIVSAAANSNTVTITFNTAVSDSDIRIVEYSGIDTVNASDGGVGASGTGNGTEQRVADDDERQRSAGRGQFYCWHNDRRGQRIYAAPPHQL